MIITNKRRWVHKHFGEMGKIKKIDVAKFFCPVKLYVKLEQHNEKTYATGFSVTHIHGPRCYQRRNSICVILNGNLHPAVQVYYAMRRYEEKMTRREEIQKCKTQPLLKPA